MVRTARIAAFLGTLILASFAAAGSTARAADGAPGSGQFFLELDGTMVGRLMTAGGGAVKAEVVNEKTGTGKVGKALGHIEYEDIVFTCGPDMAPAFYNWIQDTVEHRHPLRNGAVVTADADAKVLRRLEFRDTLIASVEFPALDAASKDTAYLTVRLTPERASIVKGDGRAVQLGLARGDRWLAGNYRLQIDGLEEDTRRVSKVEALVLKQKITRDSAGDRREAPLLPAGLEVGDLAITLPLASADRFIAWQRTFINGGGKAQEKTGTLAYMAPDAKTALFTVNFRGLGMKRLSVDDKNAQDGKKNVQVAMYCESLSVSTK